MAIKRITTNLIKDSDIATVDIANNAITAAKITDGNITTAKLADLSVTAGKLAGTLDLTGKTITVATATTGDNDTSPASTAFVQQEIAALVDSSPDSLNTLNELAAALGDDASFSTTVTNSIATKLPLAGGTLTGALVVTADANPALEISRGSANTTNVNLKYNTTLTGQLSAANAEFQISAAGSSTPMEFFTNGSERMRIDSSGNVGIGTSSPTSAKLEVKGAKTQSGGAPIGNVLIADSTSLAADTGGGITFQGVYQTGGAITGFASIEAMKETATHNEYGGALVLKTREDQGAMAERMRIASDGQLLINKTGSDVGASTNIVEADGNFRLQGGNRSIKFNNGSHEVVGLAQIASQKMQYASGRMTIDYGNSRVGIGTATYGVSPTHPLHVHMDVSNDTIDETKGLVKFQSSGGNGMIFGTIASSPYTSYIQSGYVVDTSLANYAISLNPLGGNVGIGTSSPDYKLHLHDSSQNSYVYMSGGGSLGESYGGFVRGYGVSGSGGNLDLGVHDAGGTGFRTAINVQPQGNAVIFSTAGTERMRIDGSGNLLVGKTTGASATAGHRFNPNGSQESTASGTQPLYLNRLSSDGNIIVFDKDNSTVGSIGSSSPALYIGSGDVGVRFDGANDRIRPVGNASNLEAVRNNAIDLGDSGARFKDLYLSGGTYLGGTGSANHLDDYEEGTWTPVVQGGTTTGTGTYSTQSGTYRKIGLVVHITCRVGITNHTGTGHINITGLPFSAGTGNETGFNLMYSGLNTTTGYQDVAFHIGTAGNTGTLFQSGDSAGWTTVAMDTAFECIFNGTYTV